MSLSRVTCSITYGERRRGEACVPPPVNLERCWDDGCDITPSTGPAAVGKGLCSLMGGWPAVFSAVMKKNIVLNFL